MKRTKLVESSLGIKTTEKLARKLDEVLKTLPQEQRTIRRKSDTQVTDVNQGERSEVSVINSNAMDRDCEIVLPEGIEYQDFQKYGTVLYSHDLAQPVGKCQWIKTRPDALLAKTSYPRRPANYEGQWLPDFVWNMIAAEILRGKSIGFLPVEVREPTTEELAKYPDVQRVITRGWLIEYSVVSAPCNPEALIEQIGKGVVKLEDFGWKTIGRAKKKLPPKVDKLAQLQKAIRDTRIDYKQLVAEEFKRLRERWEV